MTTGAAAGTGGAAPTGGAPTGAAPTGGAPTGATGGIEDPRLKTKTDLKIPEKYANEPWAKEVKNVDDLWDKMNGAQKLIGKDKVVIPGENATEEMMAEFREKMGVPKSPDEYEFASIEDLQDIDRNLDLDKGMKQIFHKHNVPKQAGEAIVKEYESLVYDIHKPTIEATAQRNLEFQKLADEVLGEDRVASMEAFKGVMKESLGDKAYLADKIDQMSNEELIPLIVFSKKIHDTYVGESKIPGRPGQQPGLSGDLKTDFQTLSAQKVSIKMDKNMPEHVKKLKLSNINTQMTKIGAKASEQGIDLFK